MHADDFFINNGADRHDVEHIEEVLPNLEIIASLAFIMGKVHSS